jgi:hypothetical protein
MSNRLISFVLSMLLLLLGSCSKETSQEDPGFRLRVRFVPEVNGFPVGQGVDHVNSMGEEFRMDVFRIYVGNFALMDEGSTPVADNPDDYHLLDVYDSASLSFDIRGNRTGFRRIRMQVGIDSIRNVSGAQSGALDPMLGMFWTWSTGYIHAKFEGSSPASTRADKRFTYHIGGFRQHEDTKRVIQLDLPIQNSWVLDKNGLSEVSIHMDIDAWFRSAHELPITAQAQIMQPGAIAVRYADNYARMFTLESIERK